MVNVTTAPATGTLVADLNVALTLAGLPGAIVVTAAFVVGSVRVSVSVGGAAGGVPPPPEPPDDAPPETPLPPQADNTAEMSGTSNNNAYNNIYNVCSLEHCYTNLFSLIDLTADNLLTTGPLNQRARE